MNFMGETQHLNMFLIQPLNLLMMSLQCMKTLQNLTASLFLLMLPRRNHYHQAMSSNFSHQLQMANLNKAAMNIPRKSMSMASYTGRSTLYP